MSYSGRINKIIASLNDRGFSKKASEVSEVKEAMLDISPLQSKRAYDSSGKPIVQNDPDTGAESVVLWGRPMTKKELAHEVHFGAIDEGRLKDQFSRGDQSVQKFLAPFIDMAQKKQGVPRALGVKLAHISNALEKTGYTILINKFNTAVEGYLKAAAESEEEHTIPSVEKTYEKSKSLEDFGKGVKKLIRMYDNIDDLIKEFDKKYETEVLDKIESKDISEADAVKKTVQLVDKVDAKSNSEITKLS
jgi:hypothetical protein